MAFKKPRLQLYADECFPLPSVNHLKSQGVSIIHAVNKNLTGKSDLEHLKESKRSGRVLITLDRDMMVYKRSSLKDCPGVIVVSAGSAVYQNVNVICDRALKKISTVYAKEALVIVTKAKIIRYRDGVKDGEEYY